jgi:hypothetical protein
MHAASVSRDRPVAQIQTQQVDVRAQQLVEAVLGLTASRTSTTGVGT